MCINESSVFPMRNDTSFFWLRFILILIQVYSRNNSRPDPLVTCINTDISLPLIYQIQKGSERAKYEKGGVEKVFLTAKNTEKYANHAKANH